MLPEPAEITEDMDGAVIPAAIAETVVTSKSYSDDGVIYPALQWLRKNAPVGRAFVEGYDPIWIITKHADVQAISRDAKTFNNGDNNLILNTQASDVFIRSMNKGKLRSMNSLAFMDQPEHARYRGITSNYFMQGRVRRLEEVIRKVAKQSVSDFLARGGECDFVRDFIVYYPLRVITNLLGIPQEDEPWMMKLTQELFGGDDPDEKREGIAEGPDAAARRWRAALDDFYTYFRKLSLERRASPRDDLISLIANTKFEGEFIDEDREFDYYIALATAGHDTTSYSSAGGMLGLLRYPDQLELLKSDHSLIASFVDEAIRYAVPIKHFMRTAARDIEVRGQKIRANERLFLSYPAANRDPDVFTDPDHFKITRNPNPHLAFGSGPHMCIGQHLAKFDMLILFEELMPHLKSIELAGQPRLLQSNFIGGIKSLPVRYQVT